MTELTRRGDVFVLDLSDPDLPDDDHRFSFERMAAINAALDEAEATEGPAALVITAQGKFFSNGLLPELFGDPEYLPTVQRLLARFLLTEVPTVAAINGHCYGGGLLLSLTLDERFARSDRGFLCLPEAALTIGFTEGLAALVMARLEPQVAHRAMVLSQRYGGDEAAAAGLVDAAVTAEELLPAAVARAAELAPLRHPVLATIKTQRYAGAVDALHRIGSLSVEGATA
jgi:enoyl-CoA hydratase/carnithine racemase